MALLLLTAAGFARLGVWQLSRLQAAPRRERGDRGGAGGGAGHVARPCRREPDTLAGRRVVARGRYDHAHEIVIRGDVLEGVPGRRGS